MSVRVRNGLQLEEFSTELTGVDYEWTGGRRAGGGGLGEEVVVGFGRFGGLDWYFFAEPSG